LKFIQKEKWAKRSNFLTLYMFGLESLFSSFVMAHNETSSLVNTTCECVQQLVQNVTNVPNVTLFSGESACLSSFPDNFYFSLTFVSGCISYAHLFSILALGFLFFLFVLVILNIGLRTEDNIESLKLFKENLYCNVSNIDYKLWSIEKKIDAWDGEGEEEEEDEQEDDGDDEEQEHEQEKEEEQEEEKEEEEQEEGQDENTGNGQDQEQDQDGGEEDQNDNSGEDDQGQDQDEESDQHSGTVDNSSQQSSTVDNTDSTLSSQPENGKSVDTQPTL